MSNGVHRRMRVRLTGLAASLLLGCVSHVSAQFCTTECDDADFDFGYVGGSPSHGDCVDGFKNDLDSWYHSCQSCRMTNNLPDVTTADMVVQAINIIDSSGGVCDLADGSFCEDIILAINEVLLDNGLDALQPEQIDGIQEELGCDPEVSDWYAGDAEPKLFGNFYPEGPPCEEEDSVYDGASVPASINSPNAAPPADPGPPPPVTPVPPSMMPVDRATGQKIERAVDLSLPMTGDGFTLERLYRGANGASGAGLVGMHWTTNWFSYVIEPEESDPLKLYGRSAYREYEEIESTDVWKTGGPANQRIYGDESITYDGMPRDTWRLKEPGGWELDYFRTYEAASGQEPPSPEYTGALARKRDVHGNTQTYYYTTHDTSGGSTVRLERIVFERATGGGPVKMAEVWFYWDLYSDNAGQLIGVEAYRPDKSSGDITHRVDYTYKRDGDTKPDAVGVEDDLIQVAQYIRVDDGTATEPVWRQLVTQYRYHGGLADEVTDTDSDGYIETGPDHALKMVILPEQIEFHAQQLAGNPASFYYNRSLLEIAEVLIESDDDYLLNADLPAKMIAKHDGNGRVTEQYLLAACGCSGSALGRRREYAYYIPSSGPYAKSIRMRDSKLVSSSWVFHTDAYYDMVEIDGVFHVGIHAGVERNPGNMSVIRTWVTRKVFTADGDLELVLTPSANATGSYSPADAGDPSFSDSTTDDGLVFGYLYDGNHRLTEVRVNEGLDLSGYMSGDISTDFTLIAKTTYDSTRPYLPITIERARVAGTSMPSDSWDIETTKYEYGFYTTGAEDLAWIKSRMEKERQEENGTVTGSGEEYHDSYSLFDANGRLVWTRSADNVLSFRSYDNDTGLVNTVIQNSSTSQSPALTAWTTGLTSNLTVTGWGRYGSGANDLKTEYERDLLGRVVHVIAPGGVDSWIVREMAENSLRSGLDYYREVMIPDVISDSPVKLAGPVEVSWVNAGGSVIRSSSYEMDDVDDADVPGTYDLGAELSRSAVIHHASGLVEETRAWHRISANAYDATLFTYDSLGRTTMRTAANGTQTHYVYDVLDRVVETKVGVSGQTELTVMEYFYDSDLTTPAQGVGNGNVTVVRQHVDSGTTRTTKNSFDFRDRLVMTENPDEPHSATAYDNLDRAVEQVVFKDAPPSPRELIEVASEDRGRHVLTDYGQRGMVYRTRIAIDPTEDTTPLYLETHRWCDEVGRVVGQWGPNAPGTKTTYDPLGRVKVAYVTDRGADAAPGVSGNYAEVYDTSTFTSDLTDDTVLEQTEYSYVDTGGYGERGEGQVFLVTHRMLGHDDAVGGEELGTGAVTTFRGFFYDAASRLIRSVDYGTNQSAFADQGGTSAPTITHTSPPDPSAGDATKLVTAIEYNTRGLTDTEEDPEQIKTRTLYDDLGRVIAVIENFDDATVAWDSGLGRWEVSNINDTEPDTDRVTSFVYNGVGDIVRRVAHIPDGTLEEIQETLYTYAALTSAGDKINSNDLLTKIQYPDEGTGSAGTTGYTVVYSYNRMGELLTETDQNGTVKTYTRDALGRVEGVVADPIATGDGVDDTIDTIEYGYDEFSRLSKVTSRFTSGGGVANEIAYAYDTLWQLEGMKQNPAGATGAFSYTGDVLDIDDGMVGYIYHTEHAGATAPSNQSRMTEIHYPLLPSTATVRTVLKHQYFDPDATSGRTDEGALNDTISLAAELWWNTGDTAGTHTTHKWKQEFLGVSMPVIGVAPNGLGGGGGGGLKLDRFIDPADGDAASGTYGGFDRYGRLARQHWADESWVNFGSSIPTRPEVFNLGYSYSNHSDITSRTDERGGGVYALNVDRDEDYGYDGLHRLVSAERGDSPVTSTKRQSQQWPGGATTGLDMLGNWRTFATDLNGDNDYTDTGPPAEVQTRSHNFANEIADVNSGPAWVYDDNGNLLTDYLSTDSRRHFTYDAWDRLVHVSYEVKEDDVWTGVQDRAHFTYYGLHQRATTMVDTDQDEFFEPDQRVHYYYDASWRLLERRIDDAYDEGWEGTDFHGEAEPMTHQYIWGTSYIDELVYYQRDLNNNHNFNDDSAGRHYALRDRNYSVIGVTGGSGGAASVERVRYTPYGESQVQIVGDANADGVVNVDDQNAVLTAWLAEIDGTPSGYQVEADFNRDGVINVDDLNAVSGAWTTTVPPDTVGYGTGNIVGYAGYIYEEEIGLYCVRHRWYDPGNGRWLTRDPAGYLDGMNQYEYCSSSSLAAIDPFGLLRKTFDRSMTDRDKQNIRIALQMIEKCISRLLKEIEELRDTLSVCACEVLDPQFDELDSRLRTVRWYLQLPEGVRDPGSLSIVEGEIGDARAETIMQWYVYNFRIELNKSDWRKWSQDELIDVLLHELFHVAEHLRHEPDFDGTEKFYRDPHWMEGLCSRNGTIGGHTFIEYEILQVQEGCDGKK